MVKAAHTDGAPRAQSRERRGFAETKERYPAHLGDRVPEMMIFFLIEFFPLHFKKERVLF